jgi:cold shock CspA family protein
VPGAILKYDEEKGFGFIKPDRGSEAGDSWVNSSETQIE